MTGAREQDARLSRTGSFSTRPSARGHFRGLEPGYDDECEKKVTRLKAELKSAEEELARLAAGRGKVEKYRDPEYLRVLDAKDRHRETALGTADAGQQQPHTLPHVIFGRGQGAA